jgi:hypothetical protein
VGVPVPAPAKVLPNSSAGQCTSQLPPAADPPARLR